MAKELQVPTDYTEASFFIGGLSRAELEDVASDLGVDYDKHTSSDDLRADVLEAWSQQQDESSQTSHESPRSC